MKSYLRCWDSVVVSTLAFHSGDLPGFNSLHGQMLKDRLYFDEFGRWACLEKLYSGAPLPLFCCPGHALYWVALIITKYATLILYQYSKITAARLLCPPKSCRLPKIDFKKPPFLWSMVSHATKVKPF